MANQITGKVLVINPTQQIPAKDGSRVYMKRELVIDATRFDPYTGERSFENTPSVEFSGDKCAELDYLHVGDVVTVSFELQGTKYKDKDGNVKYFTRVHAYKVETKQSAQHSPAPTSNQQNEDPFPF